MRERRKTIKRDAKEAKKRHSAKWQDVADADIADEEAHAGDCPEEGEDDDEYYDDSDCDSYYTDDDDEQLMI